MLGSEGQRLNHRLSEIFKTGLGRAPARGVRQPGAAFRYASAPVAEEAEWLDAEERPSASTSTSTPSTRWSVTAGFRLCASLSGSVGATSMACSNGAGSSGELAHLNAYARAEHLSSECSTTKAGRPDRRYGPRGRATK